VELKAFYDETYLSTRKRVEFFEDKLNRTSENSKRGLV
jgi:hypothetical protein